jgi:hypothetical protein
MAEGGEHVLTGPAMTWEKLSSSQVRLATVRSVFGGVRYRKDLPITDQIRVVKPKEEETETPVVEETKTKRTKGKVKRKQ